MADYGRILILQATQGSAGALAKEWHVWPELMPTLRGLLWIVLPSWVGSGMRNFLLLSGTLAGLLYAGKHMRSAKDGVPFDLAFALAVGVVALVSFHSYLHDFSLMILPLLIAGETAASSVRVWEKNAYLIVTLGFLFFSTLFYLLLDLTRKVGLLALPMVVALLLMSRWETNRLRVFEPAHRAPRASVETA